MTLNERQGHFGYFLQVEYLQSLCNLVIDTDYGLHRVNSYYRLLRLSQATIFRRRYMT